VSALLLSRIPATAKQPESPSGSLWAQVKEGLTFVSRHPVIRPCMLAVCAANFVNGALIATLPVYLLRTAGIPPAAVGAVIALNGIGGIAGAALTTWLANRIGDGRALLAAAAAQTPVALLIPLSTRTWGIVLLVVGHIGLNMTMVVLGVITRSYRQSHTPAELLTRVTASIRFITWSVVPIGAICAGTISALATPTHTLWFCAGALVLTLLSLFLSPIRNSRTLA
jgi:predicted MFS family arabinose efflux permease